MTEEFQESAPVLSTPDTRIFDEQKSDTSSLPRLSDEQVHITYEIERCVREIRQGRWRRIALQFPDHMLIDAPRVFQYLAWGLKITSREERRRAVGSSESEHEAADTARIRTSSIEIQSQEPEKLFILADTSYGACCVDEVAAEHASADVVIHYGRSCLSPTARLPVIYVFTKPPLDMKAIYRSFEDTYTTNEKVVLMADIPYQTYLAPLAERLQANGYHSLFVTSIVHDTASFLPNRTVPAEVTAGTTTLNDYTLFHVSDPPPSLLLTISSRVRSIHIYPTDPSTSTSTNTNTNTNTTQTALPITPTSLLLRRRYALLTRLTTAPIIGILINTLSVSSYMSMLTHLKRLIRSAGKKSYTFVVGKVNAAKIANFAEVGGWVVVGCWESSLFDSSEFWKPVVTPWELEVALQRDGERVWTGDWRSDFKGVLGRKEDVVKVQTEGAESGEEEMEAQEEDSEEESAPPEFDLRTGRYVSHSRPMALAPHKIAMSGKQGKSTAQALIKRANGDLATIGGEVSPAAEFFKNKRSWQGLGSDYAVEYDAGGGLLAQEAAKIEIGRSGIAKGYVVGDQVEKR